MSPSYFYLLFSLMRSLCSFSISYIFFLIPTGLSPVCLCFGTFGMVTRCFLTFWGECVEKLPDYVFLLPILPFWIFFFLWGIFFHLLHLNFIFVWCPSPHFPPVSVSAMATQTALPPDREAEGQRRGGGGERVPVKVKFTKNSLTYMDRLLLKKHRRYR